MITIKKRNEQERMMHAGKLLSELFAQLSRWIEPGMSTLAIDGYIDTYIKEQALISCSKGYLGYRHASCISLNDEVVHGVPKETMRVKEGDVVKIDVCASYNGYCADMARSFFLGVIPDKIKKFIDTAQKALDDGISKAIAGERLSNISAAIQKTVETNGYGVVREFAGHGIGKKMHEAPEILNYGKPGMGPVMQPGMAFAIEPMITMGDYRIFIEPDGWTVKTVDKSLAAHVEDTIIVTEHGPHVITR